MSVEVPRAPDGIEPVEALRSWVWDRNKQRLMSLNSGQQTLRTLWEPGRALEAVCNAGPGPKQLRWTISSGGMNYQQAINYYRTHLLGDVSRPPEIGLPKGMGYAIQETDLTHEAPHEHCKCGIYAARSWRVVPPPIDLIRFDQTTSTGFSPFVSPFVPVWGKVKLWGKVIPGTAGYRAQFAYPSALYVPGEFAKDPALLAYGVPVVDVERTGILQGIYEPNPYMSGATASRYKQQRNAALTPLMFTATGSGTSPPQMQPLLVPAARQRPRLVLPAASGLLVGAVLIGVFEGLRWLW